MKKNKVFCSCLAASMLFSSFGLTGCGEESDDAIVLRISNWEEYIDLGDWEEDEAIDLSEDQVIFGENSLIDDFEQWFYETYGKKVRVEYSTFGTNEELYNQLTIGDTYDLICPSEYMIMKMMTEDMLVPYSDSFFDSSIETNYYINNLSPYISRVYDELSINGEVLKKYGAGYMWGTLGLVYDPEEVTKEQAAHWNLLLNEDFYKRITVKDSVRDSYFAALGIAYYDQIFHSAFIEAEDYHEKLSEVMNRTDVYTVNLAEDILSKIRKNVYSFETDAGKADMVTGKVVANLQWSGDAVYTMDQAEEDDLELCYSCPEEGTNLWFDGWVMLKKGINGDAEKQMAAEAFVNFVSRPDNAIRNMYYIGYTSVISGGDSGLIFDYLNWNYGAEEEEDEEENGDAETPETSEEEDLVEYQIGYFFTDNEEEYDNYIVITTEDQTRRQLYAQYPTYDVVSRSVVMACFDDEANIRINRMWTNVRCFDIFDFFGK